MDVQLPVRMTMYFHLIRSPVQYVDSFIGGRQFAFKYPGFLDHTKDEMWNDLHMLFGAVCCIAELQIALPGELRSSFPLKQVLDRRPFI